MSRIVQISDTHLTRRRGVTRRNFDRVAAFINDELRPDLIVHSGDAIAAFPDDAADREAAQAAIATLDAPVHVLAGNHDVGEPGTRPWMGFSVTSDRVSAHRAAFDGDRFAATVGAWFVIGLNTELLGSGLPDEAEQWEWLRGVAAGAGARPTILFVHKPLWLPRRGPSDAALSVPPAARRRLLRMLSGVRLRAIASGHLHRSDIRDRPGDVKEVWCPAVGFITPERPGARGARGLGVTCWDLGRSRMTVSFAAPPGLDERVAGDIPELAAYLQPAR